MMRKDKVGDTMLNFYGGNDLVYNQSFFKQFPKDTHRGYATSITIPVSDIQFVYRNIESKAKESIIRELTAIVDSGKQWQDFRLQDPFGFYVRVTELINWGQ